MRNWTNDSHMRLVCALGFCKYSSLEKVCISNYIYNYLWIFLLYEIIFLGLDEIPNSEFLHIV